MPKAKKYDLVALSSAAVDIVVSADDAFIKQQGLDKALSNDVGVKRMREILAALGKNGMLATGGPGGNVASGIANYDGRAAIIGKIANDDHGRFYTQSMKKRGVDFTPVVASDPHETTSCILCITTPDKERTFAASVSAGHSMTPEDAEAGAHLIRDSKILYMDGYLWRSAATRETIGHAAEIAQKSDTRIALALNDFRLIGEQRDKILSFARYYNPILVGDRREFGALFGRDNFEDTARDVAAAGFTAAITRGGESVAAIDQGEVKIIPARKVENIVDTNGAGDQFAAGFLSGLADGMSAEESANIGVFWASLILKQKGATPRPLPRDGMVL